MLLLSSFGYATVYTVGSGKTYSTIAACAAVAVAGDTCDIYNGIYSGWTQSANGSAGNPITFQAHSGETVNVSTPIVISGASYLHITGINFTGTGSNSGITADGSSAHNLIDHNTAVDILYYPASGYPSGSDTTISYNTVNWSSNTSSRASIGIFGDRNLVEHNEMYNGGGDCVHLGGTNVVMRLNNCHDENANTSGEHIDMMQEGGGQSPLLNYSLIENNTVRNCVDSSGNCHVVFMRTSPTVGNSTNNIIRFNFAQNLNGGGNGYGGPSDNVINTYTYNNTLAIENIQASNGTCTTYNTGATGVFINNICYNSTTGLWSPVLNITTPFLENGNIAYTTGWSGAWGTPYNTEATYATLANVNPQFANYPTDATLKTGSGAIGSGVALTTVASGDSGSGTSLVLNDAGYFQSYASTADCISVTTVANHVCITSINYGTNTVTLASGISRSHGDSVWLYSDSTARQVLFASGENVGSYQGSGIASAAVTAAGVKMQGVVAH